MPDTPLPIRYIDITPSDEYVLTVYACVLGLDSVNDTNWTEWQVRLALYRKLARTPPEAPEWARLLARLDSERAKGTRFDRVAPIKRPAWLRHMLAGCVTDIECGLRREAGQT